MRPLTETRANGGFPTTRWSLVVRAGDAGHAGRQHAMAELLEQYLVPMRTHIIIRKGVSADNADDLLQSFLIERVLEANLIACADQKRGRFRNFLLTALDHFIHNHFRAQQAGNRSPLGNALPVDISQLADPSPGVDEAFDVAWAREVLDQAVVEMRNECQASKRLDVWGIFEARVLSPTLEAAEPIPYRELVDRFNLIAPSKAYNLSVTGTRMFHRALRSVIERYEDAENVEAELMDLRRILSKGGARSV